MWIHISKIAKQLSFPHKQRWKPFTSYFSAKPSKIIVENTENLPNSSSYTIEHKLVRNSHLLSQKLAFSQVPHQLFFIQSANCSHANYQKQQLTAHTSIVKRYMAKCYKHAPISLNHTIVVTGVSKSTNIHAQNTIQTKLAHIVITI